MTDQAYKTLSEMFDTQGALARDALLADIERAARSGPRPWVAALQRVRAERPIEPVVVTYLLHLMMSGHVVDRLTGDPEIAALLEVRRAALDADREDEDKDDVRTLDEQIEAEKARYDAWLSREGEIRNAMSARYRALDAQLARDLGEDEYAAALADLPTVLADALAGRAALIPASWPLGFAEVLRATGQLRVGTAYVLEPDSFVATAAPRDVLLAILDRSSRADRNKIVQDLTIAGVLDPFPWLDALRALRVERRISPDEGWFLARAILLEYLFEIEPSEYDDPVEHQLEALAALYAAEDWDVLWCDREWLEELPAEIGHLRTHIENQHVSYVRAAFRELGEPEVGDGYDGVWAEDEHTTRFRRIQAELFT